MDNVKIAKALSDPIRYKIMMMLVGNEYSCCSAICSSNENASGLCNCEIMAELEMIQSRVSYHMKELVDCGLVDEEPRGKWKYYYVNRGNLQAYISRLMSDFKLD